MTPPKDRLVSEIPEIPSNPKDVTGWIKWVLSAFPIILEFITGLINKIKKKCKCKDKKKKVKKVKSIK